MTITTAKNWARRGPQPASVVSDVPLFSIGLMAFGTFTFLTLMRRASLPVCFLFVASSLTFGAAILDLSKALAEANGIEAGQASPPLDVIRDTALATCAGLIYLTMWLFIAERPQVEAHTPLPYPQTLHSGDWSRWGSLGNFTKGLSLLLCLIVPILRILWHQSTPSMQGPLLVADAIIEIVLSGLFILKLALNVSQVPSGMGWKALRDYIAPIAAMIISISLAGNNLATISQVENGQAFTDTTLGRFLMAAQLYILLIFALVNVFYQDIKGTTQPTAASPQPRDGRSSTVSMPSTWIGPRRLGLADSYSPHRVSIQVSDRATGGVRQVVDGQKAVVVNDAQGGGPLPQHGHSRILPPRFGDHSRSGAYPPLRSNFDQQPNSSSTTLDRILHHKHDLDRAFGKLEILSVQDDDIKEPPWAQPASVGRQLSAGSETLRPLSETCVSELSLPPSKFPSSIPPIVTSDSGISTQRISVNGTQRFTRSTGGETVWEPSTDIFATPVDIRSSHDSRATKPDAPSSIGDTTMPPQDWSASIQANCGVVPTTSSSQDPKLMPTAGPPSPGASLHIAQPSSSSLSNQELGRGFTLRPLLLGTLIAPPPSLPGRSAREAVHIGPGRRASTASRRAVSEGDLRSRRI